MCFHANATGYAYSTGVLPNIYSGSFSSWTLLDDDTVDMSLYGENTFWKLDKSGNIWEGADIMDRNMVNIQWQRRGYQSMTFTDVAVMDNIAFAISNLKAFVYTGK